MNRLLDVFTGRKLRPVIDTATAREGFEWSAWQAKRDHILSITGFVRHLAVDLGIVILLAILIRHAAQRYWFWF